MADCDKDYVVQIKIKNGPMLRAMRASGFDTASSLARATNCSPTDIGGYLGLTKTPISQSGNWRPSIIRISEVLKVLPEDLFPEQHLKTVLRANSAEIDMGVEDIAAVIDWGGDGSPESYLVENEKHNAMSQMLSNLSPRIQRVLALRFGLDGDGERTLAEIGKQFGVSKDRIRQLEAVGLRRLRAHEHKTRALSNAGWVHH